MIDLDSPHDQCATLGDGFRVNASITTNEIEDALLVPVSALLRRDEGWAVFVVQDGRAHERKVEVAGRGSNVAAVRSGLVPRRQLPAERAGGANERC